MRITKLAIALLAVTPLGSRGADEIVATLTEIEGNVLLSTGTEMSSAKGPVGLVAGIRVLPSWQSGAVVVFDDGCRVQVHAGERYVVDKASPCRAIAARDANASHREAR